MAFAYRVAKLKLFASISATGAKPRNVMCNCSMTMTKLIPYFIFLILTLSCYSRKIETQLEPNIIYSESSEMNIKENIHFYFSVEDLDTFKESIKIKATLHNTTSNSIYFLTSTCFGEQYSLQYDKIKFELIPIIQCNASYPKIIEIKPNGQHDFKAYFKYNGVIKKMYLGFDFYSVDRTFKLSNVSLNDIFSRTKDKKTVL